MTYGLLSTIQISAGFTTLFFALAATWRIGLLVERTLKLGFDTPIKCNMLGVFILVGSALISAVCFVTATLIKFEILLGICQCT